MEILTIMCELFLAMGIGILLCKRKILDASTNSKLSILLINICIPCIILSSVSSVPRNDPVIVLRVLAAGVLSYLLYFVIGYIFNVIMRTPDYLRGTYICMMAFPNAVFIGYPIVQTMFGDMAIFYASIFNMPFNVLFFTLGIGCFRKDALKENKFAEKSNFIFNVREIINNGLIASIIALIIYFFDIPVPDVIYSCTSFIGNIATPMSMIIIGSSLGTVSLSDFFQLKKIWPLIPFRLAIIPLLVWLLMHLFTKDPLIISICTIGAGMPTASIVAMGAGEYPTQNRIATFAVVISTLFSIVSIPIMLFLLKLTL